MILATMRGNGRKNQEKMQKKPKRKKEKKENDTSDNYFAVQYFLTHMCMGLKVSSGEIFYLF